MAQELKRLNALVQELSARVDALERQQEQWSAPDAEPAKRKPGRPPKVQE